MSVDVLLDINYFFVCVCVCVCATSSFLSDGQSGIFMYFCLNPDLIEEVTLSFNDVLVTKLTSVQLDYWSGFSVSGSKRAGYDVMTGHIAALNEPYIAYNGYQYGDGVDSLGVSVYNQTVRNQATTASAVFPIYGRDLPATTINVPFPFFFNYYIRESNTGPLSPAPMKSLTTLQVVNKPKKRVSQKKNKIR